MRPLLLNVFLGLVWTALTGEFTSINFVMGLVSGYILIFIFQGALFPNGSYHKKVFQAINFFLYFFWELLLSNLRVAREVLTPKFSMKPGIVGIPLDLKSDLEITVLANLITLTPGTLSLDVSDDRKTLYVHSMYVTDVDSFRASIKNGFEKRVRELFQ
ncbi:MAG: Na+/H+ antiporter subunit E [Chloroflexi bacterium]|nr:Na+/H+ antiporter subunit E [Chloroflexota bacterium]